MRIEPKLDMREFKVNEDNERDFSKLREDCSDVGVDL